MPACAIGICAAVERARWTVWDEIVTMAPRSYATAVQSAGAVALLLPPDEAAVENPEPLLDRIDGLILAGGSDVSPGTYGAETDASTGTTWPERDRFELAVARAAMDRGMPVLGICRGMQMLNVAMGGTLHQHLPDLGGHTNHMHTPGAFGDHEVHLEPGSLAARVAGGERLRVKSHHHQGIDRLGDGLKPTGWSLPDELVEAIELPGRDEFALGVLWHPEEEEVHTEIIGSLVAAAQGGVRA